MNAAEQQRDSLSSDALLVLEALETVKGDGPLAIHLGISPDHGSRLEPIYNELQQGGYLQVTGTDDLLVEYRFG